MAGVWDEGGRELGGEGGMRGERVRDEGGEGGARGGE